MHQEQGIITSGCYIYCSCNALTCAVVIVKLCNVINKYQRKCVINKEVCFKVPSGYFPKVRNTLITFKDKKPIYTCKGQNSGSNNYMYMYVLHSECSLILTADTV